MDSRFHAVLIFCLLVVWKSALSTNPPSPRPEITISATRLIGTNLRDGKVHAFLGVPYAVPPVSANAFKPAIPLTSLNSDGDTVAFEATTWSSHCHVFHRQANNTHASADCLKIDFLRPSKDVDTNLLVIFSNEPFSAEKLANLVKLEVAVAVVHVREGVLGYATLAPTEKENSNYGISDILVALDFIQTNVKAFGVSNRIVIAAEGDVASAVHVAFDEWYPRANADLKYQLVLLNGHKKLARFQPSLKTHDNTVSVLRKLGCHETSAEKGMDCLRSKDLKDIIDASQTWEDDFEEFGAPFRLTPQHQDGAVFSPVPLILAVDTNLDPSYYQTENDFNPDYSESDFESFLSRILENEPIPTQNLDLLKRQLRHQYIDSVGDAKDAYFLWKQSRQILYDKVYHASTAALIKQLKKDHDTTVFLGKYQVPSPLKTCLGDTTPEYQQPFCDLFFKFVVRYVIKGEPTKRECDPGKPKWPELSSSKRPYFIELKDDGTIEWDHNFGQAADALWNKHLPFLESLNLASSETQETPQDDGSDLDPTHSEL
uniref:COesterase domain-containing protein n=1 Tax=Panagrellus redivivus TaxID=6233 RepID=A0A7E4VDI6_PANRE